MAIPIAMGRVHEGVSAVIYGPPGVGKTELVSLLPDCVFIDVEGSTDHMATVKRMPKPTSWQYLMALLAEFSADTMGFKTLNLESADWFETLCIQHVCGKLRIASLGAAASGKDGDFGQSYNALEHEWCTMLDVLTEIRRKGINIVFTAHSTVKLREVPEEFGRFEHYKLKMEKKTSAKLIEWAQFVLFVNYETSVVKDAATQSQKAKGGERYIHTLRHVCWEAKARLDMDQSLPDRILYERGVFPAALLPTFTCAAPVVVVPPAPSQVKPQAATPPTTPPPAATASRALRQMLDKMEQDGIDVAELQKLIFERKKMFPLDTPLENYPDDFIAGWALPNWPKIVEAIKGETANV